MPFAATSRVDMKGGGRSDSDPKCKDLTQTENHVNDKPISEYTTCTSIRCTLKKSIHNFIIRAGVLLS